MKTRSPKTPRAFEDLFEYEGFLTILRYYIDLNCFIIHGDPWNGDTGWLAAHYHQRAISLFDFEKKYKHAFNWDKLTDPVFEGRHKKGEPLLLETLGFYDIFTPIRRKGERLGTVFSGAFAGSEVTYDRLRVSWKQLTGQTAAPENNEFREFARVMLETPVLEGRCLSAYREALELFAGVLAHGNLPRAAQRLQALLTGVFSKYFSHSYFVDWALGLPTRQATPIWSTQVAEWNWVRKDIGLTRIPTTVITAIPMNTYGKRRDPIEEMLRVYRFQRRSFRFAQTLPETLGSKLENYGALFITSPDPAKSRPQRRAQILELARRIHAFAQEELGGPALVGVGETVTPGETLYKSYQEAVLALHLGRDSGQEVVLFKPAGVETAQGILEITRMFRELQRQIETASLSGLEPALDKFLKQVLTLSLNDPEKIRLHLQYGLIQMGEKICARSTLNEKESALLLEGMVLAVEKAGTTQEMVLAFKDTLEKLLSLTQGQGALQANFSIEKVRNYLDEHFKEPLRVAKLARLAGVSASTLSRWFKKANGLGLENYLQDLRLEEARRLLRTGSLPVEQIARACGFKPGSHFARFFRRKTGQSPQQFRESSQRS